MVRSEQVIEPLHKLGRMPHRNGRGLGLALKERGFTRERQGSKRVRTSQWCGSFFSLPCFVDGQCERRLAAFVSFAPLR